MSKFCIIALYSYDLLYIVDNHFNPFTISGSATFASRTSVDL